MKSTKNLVSVTAIIAALLAVSFASVYTMAQDQKVPTKKELMTLLKTANEPPEHRRIAAYYRQESQRLTIDAKFHREMGRTYEKQPLSFEAKHPYGTIGISHCKYWADLDVKQAKEADTLAALHEEMAKAAEQKQ